MGQYNSPRSQQDVEPHMSYHEEEELRPLRDCGKSWLAYTLRLQVCIIHGRQSPK